MQFNFQLKQNKTHFTNGFCRTLHYRWIHRICLPLSFCTCWVSAFWNFLAAVLASVAGIPSALDDGFSDSSSITHNTRGAQNISLLRQPFSSDTYFPFCVRRDLAHSNFVTSSGNKTERREQEQRAKSCGRIIRVALPFYIRRLVCTREVLYFLRRVFLLCDDDDCCCYYWCCY